MSGKWSFMELLNPAGSAEYQEIFLSPYDVEPSEENFYSQENIEELADSIAMVGQQQPTVLALMDGRYKIISGHRRNLANRYNIERGAFPADYKARYLYREMPPATYRLSLLVGNAFNRKLSPYEETEQAGRLKKALIQAREEDGLEIKGKLRDLVAELLQTSPTRIARMDKINASLIPEAKEQFRAGKLNQSAAYEASKLPPKEQEKIAADAAAGQKVTHKDIADMVKEKRAEKLKTVKPQETKEHFGRRWMLEELLQNWFGLSGPLCEEEGDYTEEGLRAYGCLVTMLEELGKLTDKLPTAAVIEDLDRIEEET